MPLICNDINLTRIIVLSYIQLAILTCSKKNGIATFDWGAGIFRNQKGGFSVWQAVPLATFDKIFVK